MLLASAIALVVAALVVAVVVLRTRTGSSVAAERIDPAPDGVAIKDVTASSADRPSDDATVGAVLTDLNTFWSGVLPASFRRPLTPLAGGYQAVDPGAPAFVGSALCLTSPDQIAGNAYYCPTGDGIVFDAGGLVPVLLGHYGPAGLAVAFAHEFGHAIQARIGPTSADRTAHPDRYPSLVVEAQGDCYAGAFLAWAVAGHAVHVHIPESSLVRALGPLLDFADPVTTKAGADDAHGLALDRLDHVLVGYSGGATACAALSATSVFTTLGRAGTSPPGSPRFATAAAVQAAARASVLSFAATVSGRAVAPADPAPDDADAAAPYGQFAQAATVALAVGRTVIGSSTGAACFTGAWSASVFGHAPAGALGSWTGDADEALNLLRARPGASFAQLRAFLSGFTGGEPACAG